MTPPGASHRVAGSLVAALAERLGPAARVDVPLGPLTTYRVGGPAAMLVHATSERDLATLQDALGELDAIGRLPLLVLGNGSNMLVADAGFPGLVLRLGGELGAIAAPDGPGAAPDGPGASPEGRTGEVAVRAGGGADLPRLARQTVRAGLAGMEWAVGIPGTVGGALKMNAGGHGRDTASCLVRFRMIDLEGEGFVQAGPERLHFGYRSSALRPSDVVVWAEFSARRGSPPEAGRAALAEIVRWRRDHQPGGSNAGSVFTNPPADSAGRLVEACGLKGFRLRSARVSEKHANFIQADDGGSADDVWALMAHVRRTVAEATGVVLHPEVKLVGFPEDAAPPGGMP